MLSTIAFALNTFLLRGVERQSTAQIMARQERQWRRLLQRAMNRSPFYRKRLHGIDPRTCRLTDIPPLGKAEMMDNFDSLVTDRSIRKREVERFVAKPANLGKFFLGRYAVCHTSGSQGQPALIIWHRRHALLGFTVQVARGSAQPANLQAVVQRLLEPVRVATVTQKPGFYPSGSAFAYLASARLQVVKFLRLSVFDPTDVLVAQLNEFRPHHLSGYTGALENLAREQLAGRLQLRGSLQLITSFAEPLPESSRHFIEKAFGVRIADFYSMAECPPLTTGCIHYSGSHVNSDLALFEVVDDQYRPVPAGQPGTRVLVTNLFNEVQPMIRYEIGDVVTMSPAPCPCGSPLPLIQSVQGRTKERFWIEVNGVYRDLPYYLFLAPLHNYLDMAEHQVLQIGHNRFVVRAAPLPGKTLSLERLRQLVSGSIRAEGLHHLLQVDVEIVNMIPPDPNTGKNQRARNMFGPPPKAEDTHRAMASASREDREWRAK